MKFELHCHSCYSKGVKIPCEGLAKPEEIIRKAKGIGLSGIAITDHRTTKAWASASKEAKKQGIIFIPGVELQTSEGHLIALGITEPVENFLGVEESIGRIHEAGGIAVAPHPFDLRGEGLGNLAFKADAVEIFNSMNIDKIGNRFTLSKFKNSGIPRVVGSDAHTLEMIGQSLNIMEAGDVDSVLKAILKGKVQFKTEYIPMNDIINWARGRFMKSKKEVLEYTNSHYFPPKAWLYRKMLKKFLRTGNAPWIALAEMSLSVSRVYGILKMLSY
ncbi:MAG: PHP domain-containing protein [Candidatus Aenigmarchaeota archaeon]